MLLPVWTPSLHACWPFKVSSPDLPLAPRHPRHLVILFFLGCRWVCCSYMLLTHVALMCCPSRLLPSQSYAWVTQMPFIHAARSCCPFMPPVHAARSCRPFMPPVHAARSCRPFMPPVHAARSCRPFMPPVHAARSCCPNSCLPFMLPVARSCCPFMLLMIHAARSCCPFMLPVHAARVHAAAIHAARSCCPFMLPIHAAAPCLLHSHV